MAKVVKSEQMSVCAANMAASQGEKSKRNKILEFGKNFTHVQNVAMKKNLDTTIIKRVLKHSFAVALGTKAVLLPTASAEEIIIDFKDGEVTEEAISKRLQKENENKIYVYTQLAKKLKQYAEGFWDPLEILKKDSNHDLMEQLIEDFIAIVPGGAALEKVKRSTKTCKLFPQPPSKAALEEWCETKIRFLTALLILKSWERSEVYKNDAQLESARAALHKAGTVFFMAVFNPLNQALSDFEPECRKKLDTTQKAQEEALDMKITLKNGTIHLKSFGQLFSTLKRDLYLTFDNIRGVFPVSEALNKYLVSLTFLNSNLELGAQCFQKSPFLKDVIFENSVITMHRQSFADCKYLKCPKYTNLQLHFPLFSNIFNVFERDPYIKKKDIQEMATKCFRQRCECGTFETKEDAKGYLARNELDSVLIEFYHRCNIAKQNAELKEQLEVLKKEKENLNEKISTLKIANNNMRQGEKDALERNRNLKEKFAEREKELQSVSEQFSKLSAEHENFKTQQTETVEKLTKELENIRSERNVLNQKLSEVRDINQSLKNKLKMLQSENEEQQEEIKALTALKETWEGKINKIETLETQKNDLESQLTKMQKEQQETREMIARERERKEADLKNKKQEISTLKQEVGALKAELGETQMRLFEAQAKIKELTASESYVLNTMDMIPNDEDEKEDVKDDDLQLYLKKDTFRQTQNINKKRFYPKKKSQKSKQYIEYNGEFEYEK